MPDLRESRAYQILRADISQWWNENVRVQFLKDWVKASRKEADDER